MKRFLLLFCCAVSFLGLTPSLSADTAVDFELIVRQKPSGIDKYFEIRRDTVRAFEGDRLYTFMVNFGLDLTVEKTDSQAVEFSVQLVTVGKSPYSASERYRIEYDLPGRIENIPGKHGSVYQLLISPRGRVDITDERCPYPIDMEGVYKYDPSPNFDIYYVAGSLGDFRWNNVKTYLEGDYVLFREAFGINFPGKINYYLCPCAVEAVNWDKRFGFAVDPGRARAFAIYNRDFSSAEAVLTNITQLLRVWGYAPPFLVEGLAGYFEFVNYEAKKAFSEKGLLPVEDILTSANYYRADPLKAELTAASFVKYITDQYGLARAKKLYEESDDLTLALQFKALYGKTTDSLETEWHNYLDTVGLTREQFDYYAKRAALMLQFDKEIEYLEAMRPYNNNRRDSINTLTELNMAYYNVGRYYDAENGYGELIRIDTALPVYWQVLGNLNMINGDYDKAWKDFDSVYALDTTYASAKLRQAQLLAIKGDTAKAIATAQKYYSVETSTPAKIEFLLFLGEMYEAPGKNHDSLQAYRSYSDALAWTREVLASSPRDPSYQLRAGQALMGLGEYEDARSFLEVARFIETRTFNIGKILLILGKLNDLTGNRTQAEDYYRACLANQSAAWHQAECRRYLDEPFRN